MLYQYNFEKNFCEKNINSEKINELKDFDFILNKLFENQNFLNIKNNNDFLYVYFNEKVVTNFKDNNEMEFDIFFCLKNYNNEDYLIIIESKNYTSIPGTKSWENSLNQDKNIFKQKIERLNFIKDKNIKFYGLFWYFFPKKENNYIINDFSINQIDKDKDKKSLFQINFQNFKTKKYDLNNKNYEFHINCNLLERLNKLINMKNFDEDWHNDNFSKIFKTILNTLKKSENSNETFFFNIIGSPGTGKTFLAFMIYIYYISLKDKNYEIFFWIINKKFFNVIKEIFPNLKFIFAKTSNLKWFLNQHKYKDKNNIILIDEFQKIWIDDYIDDEIKNDDDKNYFFTIDELIEYSKTNNFIVLGDRNQLLKSPYENYSFLEFLSILKNEKDKNFIEWKLTKNFRLGEYLENFLLSICNEENKINFDFLNMIKNYNKNDKEDIKMNNFLKYYNFCIVNNKEEFNQIYDNDLNEFKTVSVIHSYRSQNKNAKKILKDHEYKVFPIENNWNENLNLGVWDSEIRKKYILSSFDLISNEVDSLYLFLPDDFIWSKTKIEFYPFYNIYDDVNRAYTHLWTLITRAKRRLVIYSENKETFECLKEIENLLINAKSK